MKKAEDIILEIETDSDGFQPYYRYDEVVKAIKQAQIDAIGEAVKRCADSAEIYVVDEDMSRVEFTINSESILKVAKQLRKEIE